MISAGFKLMVIGMAIVYLFLTILMLLINLFSKVFKDRALIVTPKIIKKTVDREELVAVVSAAIEAYRGKKS
ncbi:MAG: OadG family protein [Thermodesulfobacteriota bacterium]